MRMCKRSIDDVTPPSPIAPSSPSPLKGPITRSMMKKIQKGLPTCLHSFIHFRYTWSSSCTFGAPP